MVSEVYRIQPFLPVQDIEEWIVQLEDFIIALHGEDIHARRRLAILKTVMGSEVQASVRNFTTEEKESYAALTTKLKGYYKPQIEIGVFSYTSHSIPFFPYLGIIVGLDRPPLTNSAMTRPSI